MKREGIKGVGTAIVKVWGPEMEKQQEARLAGLEGACAPRKVLSNKARRAGGSQGEPAWEGLYKSDKGGCDSLLR